MRNEFRSFADEYQRLLEQVLEKPDFQTRPRGLLNHELMNWTLYVKPHSLFFMNEKRDFIKTLRYLIGETLWYFGGQNDLEFISHYSSFWKKIANSDGTCNSAYGHLLFRLKDCYGPDPNPSCRALSQWEWAYSSLVNDRDTRQAIMHFNRPFHQYWGNKDLVCTMYVNFHIRNNQLFITSRMRSQDIVRGLTYDVPFFGLLLQNMTLLLQDVYPGLTAGGVIHTSDSMHLYEEHFELAKKMRLELPREIKIHLPVPLVNEHGQSTSAYQEMYDIATLNFFNSDDLEYACLTQALKTLGGELF